MDRTPDNSAAVLSFDNLAWSPTEDAVHLWEESSVNGGRYKKSFATSTPKVSFQIHDRRRLAWHQQPSTSNPSSIQHSANRENSQGYQFFYHTQFSRGGFLTGLKRRASSLLSWSITSLRRGSDSATTHSFSGIEITRGCDEGDLINLSEIFPSSFIDIQQSTLNIKNSYHMGSLFRSEQVALVELIITKDAAYECVGELGKLGMVQFNDLNHAKNLFQRYFVRDTRRCDEVERKLRFLKQQIQECTPPIRLAPPPITNPDIPTLVEVNHIETKLDELEKTFTLLNRNESQLRKNMNEMKEFKFVLERVEQFFEIHIEDEAMFEIEAASGKEEPFSKSFGGASGMEVPLTPLTPLLTDNEQMENAWFVAGVIPRDKRTTFERVLWRACRRTAFVRTSDIRITVEDPETLNPVEKCVFIVFFKGESLKQIIDKVCDGFNARQYPCPKSSKERQHSLFDCVARINDLSVVLDTTQEQRFTILSRNAVDLPDWCQKIHMLKAIYSTLNMCTVDTNGFLAAECWIPEAEMNNVYEALQRGLEQSGSDVSPVMNRIQTSRSPPTFHRTNKFSKVFQSIVDSYGVASYREVNPAPFTIISFPFLFAVMFGDAAHGLILFLTGLFFILKEQQILNKRIRDEIFNTFFGGRYIILLMGLFSIYTGMLYNDAFAKSVNVFGSRWSNPYNQSELQTWIDASSKKEIYRELDPVIAYNNTAGPYPFGVDPVWNIADNRLSFLNSMKMKVSVILGVTQMTFGVLLSFLNYRFFKSNVDIFTNFLPQIVFLTCIFIYLCGQMIVKWLYFSAHPGVIFGQEYPGPFCAPSLLIGLINMFMLKERPVGFMDGENNHASCYLNQWYPDQSLFETILLAIAVACIPIMLFGKPFFKYLENKRKTGHIKLSEVKQEEGHVISAESSDHGMTDIIVHQGIHTIEFVLGCVSHTASYLRLWALSLAHAQLSEVLWHMVLISGMNAGGDGIVGYFVTYAVFFIFAILSLSILVLMEGLSAFLHALRLHWVEFQSKFYEGAGHAFRPYSLQDALEAAQEQLERVEDG
ncbi:unnamed protein product [Auanema sp. JU1783]|nr:unnamed protein product [Auanema sp. JU1783]